MNALIPAVGISGLEGCVMAVLYDCREDILLTSERVSWLEVDDQQLSRPGIFLLWLLLHHKLFMKPLDKDSIEELEVAGLLKIFTESKALDDYKKLNSHNVSNWPPRNWLKRQPLHVPEVTLQSPSKKPCVGQ